MAKLRALQPRTMRQGLMLVRDYLLIMIGAVCIAVSIDLFLVPNEVVTGGVSGVAIILNNTVHTPVGFTVLAMNVPLLLAGWRFLGGLVFGIRTVVATIILSIAIDALAPVIGRLVQAPHEPLLYTLYGGVLDGVGVGLVFRARGTTGGVDIVARFLQRWRGIPMGQSLFAMNLIVFAGAAYLFSFDKVLYALIVAFVSARVVDVVLEGFSYAQQALIISDSPEVIQGRILAELGRGVTVLEGQGGYTGGNRTVLLTVVARSEISVLKAMIGEADPHAFVIMGNVAEVIGEGFRPLSDTI